MAQGYSTERALPLLSRRTFLKGAAALGMAALIPPLTSGCAAGGKDTPPLSLDKGAVAACPSDRFTVAGSYDDVYNAVRASLEAAPANQPAQLPDAYSQLAQKIIAKQSDNAVPAGAASPSESAVASLPQEWNFAAYVAPHGTGDGVARGDHFVVQGPDGSLYSACNGIVSVAALQGNTLQQLAKVSLNSFNELSRWRGDGMVFVSGSVLVVVGETDAGDDYKQTAQDYLMAAYAAPRSTVAFFDVSNPQQPTYRSSVGVTGRVVDVQMADGVVLLTTEGSLNPVALGGAWSLAADGEASAAADSTMPARSAVEQRLELRKGDAASFTPAVFQSGNLTPIAANRIYIPQEARAVSAVTIACIDVEKQACTSAFSVLEPEGATYAHTAGDGETLLSWTTASLDEGAQSVAGTTSVVRVVRPAAGKPLTGMAAAVDLPGEAVNAQASLITRVDGTLVRVARSDAHLDGTTLRANWFVQALDDDLHVLSQVDDVAAGQPFGAVAFAGSYVYAVRGASAKELIRVDVSDPANCAASAPVDGSAWPEQLMSADDGSYVAYGYERVREAGDAMHQLLAPSSTAARDDASDVLRCASASSDGSLQFASPVPLGSGDLSHAASAGVLGLSSATAVPEAGLVGVPAGLSSASPTYRLFRKDDTSLTPLGEGVSVPAAQQLLPDGSGSAAYGAVSLAYDKDAAAAFVLCFGNSTIPQLLAIDASSGEPRASLALAEQVDLASAAGNATSSSAH